jgi:hypothetical protein
VYCLDWENRLDFGVYFQITIVQNIQFQLGHTDQEICSQILPVTVLILNKFIYFKLEFTCKRSWFADIPAFVSVFTASSKEHCLRGLDSSRLSPKRVIGLR